MTYLLPLNMDMSVKNRTILLMSIFNTING